MTRLSIGLFVFILTLGVGLAAAWLFINLSRPSIQRESIVPPTDIILSPIDDPDEALQPPAVKQQESAETNIESFTDYRRIGRPRKNKVEVRCFDLGDERIAEIKFYSRDRKGTWKQKQSFDFSNDYGPPDCDPKIDDLNNDRLGDLTYQSAVAARGANEIRKLFMYDKQLDQLVYVKNSEDYPNLAYNKKLNCMDAWLVYGATSTVFLRLERDTLREFASVSTGIEQTVTVTDKAGNRRIIYRKKMNPNSFEQVYTRFTTYRPPR